MRRTNAANGFTLIEVIVALAVCASSFILLLSANQASLSRSLRARQSAILEEAVESKIQEIRTGIESNSSGTLENLPGYSWQMTTMPSDTDGLQGVEEITLRFSAQQSSAASTRTVTFYRFNKSTVLTGQK